MSEDAERQCGNEQCAACTDGDTDGEGNKLANEFTPSDDGPRACPARYPPADAEPQGGTTDDSGRHRRQRRIERCTHDSEERCSNDNEDETECTRQCSRCKQQQRAEHADRSGAGNRVEGTTATHGLAALAEARDHDGSVTVGRGTDGSGTILRGGAGRSHRGHRRHRTWLRSVLFVTGFAAVVVAHGAVQWSRLDDVPTGPIDDVVRIVDDPRPVRGGVVLVVAHDSWRYRLVVRSGAGGAVVARRTGDHVRVVGERRALVTLRGRDIAGHVAGEIVARDVVPLELTSAPVYRMVSRIHTVIADVTSRLPDTDAALLRGLLIGDDRDHPAELVRAFRAAGMGHLVAVSGQNVALVLAWVAPLISGRRRSVRVAAIVFVVALFALVTRLEPSVVRAAVMVIIVRSAAAYGRDIGAARALLVTVTALLVVDPFLVRSVGFVLSVAATSGLVFLTPGLASVLGTGAVARIASATIAAQLAVAPFALWWFGSLPIVAVPANVVAVPIASGVMVVGLPLVLICGLLDGLTSLVAGVLAPGAAHVVSVIADGVVDAALVPVRIGVRALWWVAVVAERASPSSGVNTLAWVVAYGACVLSIVRRRRAHVDCDSGVSAAGSAV